MNQLKEWGFSEHWWRGEKGEYWVVGQMILFIGFALLPVYPIVAVDTLPPIWKYIGWGVTSLFSLISAFLLLWGGLELGANLMAECVPK